jgi:hypothetical protein
MSKSPLAIFLLANCTLGWQVNAAEASHSAGSTIYACKYKAKKQGVSGGARIELRNGQITGVHYENFTEGEPGQPGYSCVVDASRNNKEQKWRTKKEATTIRLEDADLYKSNSMTISKDLKGFIIDFRGAASNAACGAGSELPDAVHVPVDQGSCEITK